MSAVAKVAHIRNPLTIIAMFAVIAEVSGTIVLPLLDPQVQRTYVWFLMFFPTALVSLFFYTLHTKRDALYGPGDYADEKHFMSLVRPASTMELALKSMSEFETETSAESTGNSGATTDSEPRIPKATSGAQEIANSLRPSVVDTSSSSLAARTASQMIANAVASATEKNFQFASVLSARMRDRDRVLAGLETIYGPIQRNMMIQGALVDGLAGAKDDPILIETIHVSLRTSKLSVVHELSRIFDQVQNQSSESLSPVRAVAVFIAERRYETYATEIMAYLSNVAPSLWPRVDLEVRLSVVEDRESSQSLSDAAQ
jgi:hypothetical protein